MSIHPRLPDVVHLMRAAIRSGWYARMTNRTLRYLACVSLQRLAVKIVVGL